MWFLFTLHFTKEILAPLNRGEKFTKLNISNTWQLLKLNGTLQKMLTINTPKGFYDESLRFHFKINSFAEILQRQMKKRFSGIPWTVMSSHTPIKQQNWPVTFWKTGKSLKLLKENMLRIQKNKYNFWEDCQIFRVFNMQT